MAAPAKALTIGAFGARGSGKTAWTLQQLRKLKPRRLMVWDYKHDHMLAGVGQGYKSWPEFVAACCKPTFQARFLPSHRHDPQEQFEVFCRLAWELGNLLMLVDELPMVTQANKAPPAWRQCINLGRLYDDGTKALSIIGMGQRLAEVDKSFLDNCDVIHTGRLGHGCAKKLASQWGIKLNELTNLPDLHWIEKRADMIELQRGVLSFRDAPAKNLKASAASGKQS